MNPVSYRLNHAIRRLSVAAVGDRKDLLAMHALAPLSTGYLPWTTTAMRPSAVAGILADVVINGRQRVVELGGGISTFYLARLLRDKGGRMWTVEHDEHWAQLLERELKSEGLGEVVTVVHAPLAPTSHPFTGTDALWYAEDRLRPVVQAGGIDLLIVDGPPAHATGLRHARYPALPHFATALAPGCAVVLDDILRRGEQEILHRWERESGIDFQRRWIHGTIAVGRAGG
jgi:predicted O-methyltransferase YrrM